MARLPDPLDIALPRVSGEHAIGGFDVSPLARGLQGSAAAQERAGQSVTEGARAIGAGLGKYGEAEQGLGKAIGEVGNVLTRVAIEKNRWEYNEAHADYLTNKVDAIDAMRKDTDWQTMPDRYAKQIADINSAAAEKIGDPRMRERFKIDTRADVATFNSNVAAHARTLEGSAELARVNAQGDKFINQGVTSNDETLRAQIIDTHNLQVDGLVAKGFMTPDAAVTAKKRWAQRYATADLLRLIDDNPAEAVHRIESADEKSIYSVMAPEERYSLLHQAKNAVRARAADGIADFKASVQDTEEQALRTGMATPVPKEAFTAKLGPELGARAYEQHQATVQLGADVAAVAGMDAQEQRALVEQYNPKPGAGYADAAQRQDSLVSAIQRINKERGEDPAGFAVSRLPSVGEAFNKLGTVLTDPGASPAAKAEAARDYATKAVMEQQRIGVAPEHVAILPKAYAARLSDIIAKAADSDDPNARTGTVARIKQEAAIWGDNWPAVMRQLAPTAAPIVRAIAAGADEGAMTRLLSVPKNESPAKILKEQNETKFRDLTGALNDSMAPFRRTLVGRQLERDFPGYYGMAETLAALYVRDGDSAHDAAEKAFKKLVGDRYEFRDTYRIPKSIPQAPDDIQNGAQIAREKIAAGEFSVKPAINDMGLDDNRGDSLAKFARDGVWVTAPDNSGLNLVYGDKLVRTTTNGADKPLILTWDQLAKLRDEPPAPMDVTP